MKSLTRILLLASLFVSSTSFAQLVDPDQPVQVRYFDLVTAPFGPSIDSLLGPYSALMETANREIVSLEPNQYIGFGKMVGIYVKTELTRKICDNPTRQDANVNAFNDVWSHAEHLISLQRMAGKSLVDARISVTQTTGRVVGLTLWFCRK